MKTNNSKHNKNRIIATKQNKKITKTFFPKTQKKKKERKTKETKETKETEIRENHLTITII